MVIHNFDVVVGTTFSELIYFKTDDATPIPISIVGDTIYFTIKTLCDEEATDGSAVHAQTVNVHTNAVGGISQIGLTDDESRVIGAGRFRYDVIWKRSDGTRWPLLSGKFTLTKTITIRD